MTQVVAAYNWLQRHSPTILFWHTSYKMMLHSPTYLGGAHERLIRLFTLPSTLPTDL